LLIIPALSATPLTPKLRYTMYLTGYASNDLKRSRIDKIRQHNVVPELEMVSDITHVALAFMRSEVLNDQNSSRDWWVGKYGWL
jgi:hypothetical protein